MQIDVVDWEIQKRSLDYFNLNNNRQVFGAKKKITTIWQVISRREEFPLVFTYLTATCVILLDQTIA